FGWRGGVPVIGRVLQGGCGFALAGGRTAWCGSTHRWWSGGHVGVLAPEVVEQDGEGFGRIVEVFVGHGNGVDPRDAHRNCRFLMRVGGFCTTVVCGGTAMRMVRIPPDRV